MCVKLIDMLLVLLAESFVSPATTTKIIYNLASTRKTNKPNASVALKQPDFVSIK